MASLRSTKPRSGSKRAALALAASVAVAGVSGLAVGEPADGSLYLGAWVDSSVVGGDTPLSFINRMGFNPAVFHLSQTIPITKYNETDGTGGAANATLVELTGTSASILLTVYPQYSDLTLIADSDLTYLANQIYTYMNPPYSRQVYLRWAPEMNGNWQPYGMQPTAYVDGWKRMYNTVKAKNDNVSFVWSPYSSEGYPYGQVLGNVISAADVTALDSNKNNQLDYGDDAFEAYYPGDGYTDWVGLSYRYKGNKSPLNTNVAPAAGTVGGGMDGNSVLQLSPSGTETFTDFYSTYSGTKQKPFMWSEIGAGWASNATNAGDAQLAVQQAWWTTGIANTTLYTAFPKLKMWNLYEFTKTEDTGDGTNFVTRDYRVSTDDTIRAQFLSAFSAVQSTFVMADSQDVPSDLSGTTPSGQGLSGGSNATESSGGALLPSQTLKPNIFTGAGTRMDPNGVLGALLMGAALAMGGWITVGRF